MKQEIPPTNKPITLDNHWMPFTPNRDFKANPRLMVKASGMYYWSQAGQPILDASAGLFCCAAGHCRPEIAAAISQQAQTLDYVPHFQSAHPTSFTLAEKLATILPSGLDRIFFTNSGSESIDTAIKIAIAYFQAKGQGTRQRFISRERAYHGVNIGGTALGGMTNNRRIYGGVGLAQVAHLRHTWLADNKFTLGQPEQGKELAEDLQRFVTLYGAENIAACVVEPIAGSTGTLVPPKGYLERLREICDQHSILLIFDEVITGFGRTGNAFGTDSFGVKPDMMTLAKALTNGAVPMGAVAVKREIHDTIINHAPAGAMEFFHGYTYSGHPLACAAAHAALDIYQQENLFERAGNLSAYFLTTVFNSLRDLPIITDIRGYGMMASFDLAPAESVGLRGAELQKRLFWAGMHLKTTGDAGIIAPALIAEKSHIDEICQRLRDVIQQF
ncbi:aminotransferase class III-fold pyridoxal phosphate-dependent enzyme [Beggiatoa leptomitoformis]|uniref:Aminotransferase class III-fold pyridoxal phosphate-dependent enzyme n=1 Tax=Beggiatoa leptomitoformis TaxID=288004 RepID=A0A2N9YG93_9GAMM|nr:aminotransferase class III-fold pyridoxal phosphate-dependent enzyme [Beggiatoa leptomitoformis]ALG68280.1 aminotransferase class III-fold pyridoxal phosphate-dependent enzyme [Beggiatoa leptomitoformis]AUI69409.1 aminotransferase class III-fold pyridoxal phosphate-dependent enzyme [Beggiatoa leptomitoformis]